MGIPHLTAFLRDYAELAVLSGNGVIDGPSLAYFIYYSCLKKESIYRDSIQNPPSYAEIATAFIEWLDDLGESGITVKKIYFDGYLPLSKQDVRLERLRVQTSKLLSYFQSTIDPSIHRQNTSNKPRSEPLFLRKPSRGFTSLPPRPFLVPAIIDALKASASYNPITVVVPAEADTYCAGYVRQYGGIVFTADSDLLIYDLGSNGSVCLFEDIFARSDSPLVSGEASMSSYLYHPAVISDRLDLLPSHGLRAFAFEIIMEPQGTMRKLLMQATSQKSISQNPHRYAEFCREYINSSLPLMLDNNVSGDQKWAKFLQQLQWLDPRISEFVLQFPRLQKVAGPEVSDGHRRQICLPFLIECPVWTNAWEISLPVRQLAYGIINLIVPDNQRCSTIFEHKRKETGSKGRELQLPLPSDISKASSDLVSHFDRLSTHFPRLSLPHIWTACAVYQDIEYSVEHSKPSIASRALLQYTANGSTKSDNRTTQTWDMIHFFAQLDGSYYSFRILKQIISLVECLEPEQLPSSVSELNRRLQTLPNLVDIFQDRISNISELEIQRLEDMAKVAHSMLEVKELTTPFVVVEKSVSKMRTNRGDPSTKASDPSWKRKNPFGVLNLE